MPFVQSLWTSQSAFDDIKGLCSDRPLAGGLICVSVLECSGRRFRLTKPICIQESYDQGIWCCWEQIACEQDDNLTVDAQDLKRKLRDLVKGGAELFE
jgi:hypothetical protein